MGVPDGFGLVIEHVDVVTIEDVDAVQAQTFQGELKGAHDAIIGIVVNFPTGGRIEELAYSCPLGWRTDFEQASHFRRNYVLIAGLATQEMVYAGLGKAETIKGRGIDVSNSRIPLGCEDGLGLRLAPGTEQIAQWCGAEAQLGEGYHSTRGCPEGIGFH
jgi:hypothetical protein